MKTNNKLTKVLLAAFAMLIMGTSAFAIPKGPCEPKREVCCEEPPAGPFAFSYAKDVNLACPSDFYFNASFLLMQAHEEGLEYAIKRDLTAVTPVAANTFPMSAGEVYDYTTGDRSVNWNYGVRLNAGFYLNHDAWDLSIAWTYFRINNDSGAELNGAGFLPVWLDPGVAITSNNTTSSARWTGNLHSVDLRLGKPYHVSRYLILNPNFGLKFGWLKQLFMARNGGIYDTTDRNVDMNANNDFWGVGPKAGLDSEWHVASCFYLFGNVSAALLYSHFDVDQEVLLNDALRYQLKHDFYKPTATADMTLGLCWNKAMCKSKYLLSVKAAYEIQAWFDQNHLRRFFDTTTPSANDEVSRGNLYLSGFVFTLGWDF